jgi:hypothetical protein
MEVIIPLEEQIENSSDVRAPLGRFAVSIRPPVIEIPLLKRPSDANFVPEPGIQSLLSTVYQAPVKRQFGRRSMTQVRKHDQ